MAPTRRVALVSVLAAIVLIVVKLAAGIASGSLGLISEAAHSGTDLAAALLTFFALGVAVRPADPGHQYGHGKAEHLAALAEAAFLVVVSVLIVVTALLRLANGGHEVDATWWTFAVVGAVIAIDASRATILWRAGRRYRSPALAASSFHFASDLGGSLAVLGGLMQDSVESIEDTIPGLNRIPFFGKLFAQERKVTRKTELVIFLRATVVRDASVEGDYARFHDLLPTENFLTRPGAAAPSAQ